MDWEPQEPAQSQLPTSILQEEETGESSGDSTVEILNDTPPDLFEPSQETNPAPTWSYQAHIAPEAIIQLRHSPSVEPVDQNPSSRPLTPPSDEPCPSQSARPLTPPNPSSYPLRGGALYLAQRGHPCARPTVSAIKRQKRAQEEKRKKELLKAGKDPRPERPPGPVVTEAAESQGPSGKAASESVVRNIPRVEEAVPAPLEPKAREDHPWERQVLLGQRAHPVWEAHLAKSERLHVAGLSREGVRQIAQSRGLVPQDTPQKRAVRERRQLEYTRYFESLEEDEDPSPHVLRAIDEATITHSALEDEALTQAIRNRVREIAILLTDDPIPDEAEDQTAPLPGTPPTLDATEEDSQQVASQQLEPPAPLCPEDADPTPTQSERNSPEAVEAEVAPEEGEPREERALRGRADGEVDPQPIEAPAPSPRGEAIARRLQGISHEREARAGRASLQRRSTPYRTQYPPERGLGRDRPNPTP